MAMPGMVSTMSSGLAKRPENPSNWGEMTQTEKYDWERANLSQPIKRQADRMVGDGYEEYYDPQTGRRVSGPEIESSQYTVAEPGKDQRAQDARVGYARDFRKQMPNLAQEMGNDLKAQSAQGLSAANRGTQEAMSSRGLLYSNINRGAQAGNRARAQAGLASGISGINQGLEDAAGQLESQAVQSGMAIQQTRQQIEDGIYSQAMARMSGNNSIMGSALGLAATAGLLYATGGLGAPAAAAIGGGALGAGMLSQR